MDSFPEDKRKTVETKIHKILNQFFSSQENPVNVINITPNFQRAVQEVSNEGELYSPSHDYGIAYAKTISMIKQDKLVFSESKYKVRKY